MELVNGDGFGVEIADEGRNPQAYLLSDDSCNLDS
jgi:hypothetical protein